MPFDEEEVYSINDLAENDIYAVLRGSTFFGLDNDDNLVYGQFLPNIGITFLVFDKTNEMAPLNYSGNALPQNIDIKKVKKVHRTTIDTAHIILFPTLL
jgi:hypothetical protein